MKQKRSLVLVLVLCLSLMPMHVLAEQQQDEAISIPIMLDTLEYYQEEILSEDTFRLLQVHLTAVGRYEKQELAEKIVKHMENFNRLLDQQREEKMISEDAHNTLHSLADELIQKWLGDGDEKLVENHLNVQFEGSFSNHDYMPAADEVVKGTLTRSDGSESIEDGLVKLGGDTAGLAFLPEAALDDGTYLNKSVMVEATVKRTGTNVKFNTLFDLLGQTFFRYQANSDTMTEFGMYNPDTGEVKADAAGIADWRFQHIALVYQYESDEEATLSVYIDGCPVGETVVNSASAAAVSAVGFGQAVHPAAGDRGFQGELEAIALSTFDGQFNTDFFQLESEDEDGTNEITPANVIPVSHCDSEEKLIEKAANVIPTKRQKDWQEQELTAFIHFGMNTFTGREWGTGKEDPALFNPTDLDARQWVKTLKEAGFKTVILTAKHHDGFVLYPSRYTEHSVKNSPWKNGKGDVMRELVDAAREFDMGVGVYLSPADLYEIHAPDGRYGNGSPAVETTIPTLVPGDDRNPDKFFTFEANDYNRYFLNQLYELLTEYGPINEVWFDGANPEPDIEETYNYTDWYELIRELAPEATIAVGGPDVRWVGNESGFARESERSVIPFVGNPLSEKRDMVAPATSSDISSLAQLKKADYLAWYPAEVDVSIRPGWFYHEHEDSQVKTVDQLLDIYYDSVGKNSVLLLNIPPDKRGKFSDIDVERLQQFGEAIRATYDEDLARQANTDARNVIDGNLDTHWQPEDGKTGEIVLDFDQPILFNRVMLQENISVGQRVEGFAIDIWDGTDWQELTTATTIGYKRILRTANVTTERVRLRITDSRSTPTIATFGLFNDSRDS